MVNNLLYTSYYRESTTVFKLFFSVLFVFQKAKGVEGERERETKLTQLTVYSVSYSKYTIQFAELLI